MKIALTGIPSVGKTTLARNLTNVIDSNYIPEVARMYIKNIGRPLQPGDQYMIAKLQNELENELTRPNKLTVCDSPVYISAAYDTVYNKGKDVDKILKLADQQQYDIIFNIVDSPKYVKDGVRYHSQKDLFKLEKIINSLNKKYKTINITGIDKTKRVLDVYNKIYKHNK